MKFEGWSKASITLTTQGTILKQGDERLIRQAQKQKLFAQLKYDGIKVPQIYKMGENSIEMEFVNGKCFDDYVYLISNKKLDRIIEVILGFVRANLSCSIFQSCPKSLFETKLYEVTNKLTESCYFNLTDRLWGKFIKHFDHDFYLPIGKCHGDYTLSNIIFAEDLYLIDFLDSYIESPLLDLTKLRQDTYYGVCNECTEFRYATILRKIDLAIFRLIQELGYQKECEALQWLNLVRLLPYVKGQKFKQIMELLV